MKTQGHQQDVLFLSGTRTGFGSLATPSKTYPQSTSASSPRRRHSSGPRWNLAKSIMSSSATRCRPAPTPGLHRRARRSQVRPAHRDSRGHREPAVRFRFRIHRPGRATDSAGRVEHRAGRRRRVDEPGAARRPRGALGIALGPAPRSKTCSGNRSRTRSAASPWRRPRRTSPTSTRLPATRWMPTRSRASFGPRRPGPAVPSRMKWCRS